MNTFTTHSHIGKDGSLKLDLPAEMREKDVVIVVREASREASSVVPLDTADLWPGELFEATAGKWQGEPLVRPEQGNWPPREQLS